LNGILSTGVFASPLRQAIYNFKYHHVCGLAEPFAERMAAVWVPTGLDADLIVPVPLHPSRETERGYNQAALLAMAIAPRLGLPMAGALLARQRMTPSQVSLNWRERRENVSGAFTCCEDTSGLRVVLVDDVCTTGATLEECADALRKCGATSVWGLTVARASLPGSEPGAIASQANRENPQDGTGGMQKR
jgi:ComF family protein